MHELSLAQDILQAALDETQKAGGKRIRGIYVKVRESSHHIEDTSSLEFCLEAVAKGTIAEGAEIGIEVIPPTVRCKEWDFTFWLQSHRLFCPRCGSGNVHMITGGEIFLESLEIE